MIKRMLIDANHPEETRVVIVGESNRIEEFDFVTSAKSQIKGNIYLAKVTRVEPSLQAAFIEYGGDKQGFLSFSEIHPDYYQIPIADRKRLLEEQERFNREEAERNARREQEEEARWAQQGNRGERSSGEDGEGGEDDIEVLGNSDGEQEGDDNRQGGSRRRGRGRMRRRTFSARVKEEGATSISTSSDVVEDAGASEFAGAVEADGSAITLEHVPSGEEGTEVNVPAEASDATHVTGEMLENNFSQGEQEIEPGEKPNTLDTNSDEEDIESHRRSGFSKRYRIQEVIKRGQIMLVQVIKDERGNKGCSVTTYISLAGRCCVLMPNSSKDGGISRKVGKTEERKRLREICAEMKESCGMSVIIRTAGLGRTRVEIKRDHEYLVKLWNMIREDAIAATAPALIYEESNILKRSIRDYYNADIEEVLVQGDQAFRQAKDFMKLIMPSQAPHVKHYQENSPILSDFNVEAQLEEMYQPIARLRSGGYIVINHTEALIAIDVNSGRSTSERNVEETALKTNLEAAREVARQLRLRDLGGLIVVDFIDMFYGKNRRAVERAFKDALRADRAKIQLGHISPFGLLELSRQRIRPSIGESTTLPCQHCQGTGHIRSNDSVAIEIVRSLEREASTGNFRELRVTVSTETALHMLNRTRGYLSEIEEKFDVVVAIRTDHALLSSQYSIEKIRRSGDRPEGERKPQPHQHKDRDERKPRPHRDEKARAARVEETTPLEEEATTAEATDKREGEEGGESPRPSGTRRRSRGGRGRGRRRDGRPAEGAEAGAVNEDEAGDASPAPVAVAEVEIAAPEIVTEEAPAAKTPSRRAPRAAAAPKRKAADKEESAAAVEAADVAPLPAAPKAPRAPRRTTPRTESAAASAKTASATQESAEKKPARKGWWSKVMS